MHYTVNEIARITGGTLYGDPDTPVKYVETDSRSAFLAENSLFVALRGKRYDGHQYVQQMIKRGIRAFIVNYLPFDTSKYPGIAFIVTEDTLRALQQWAAYHRRQFDIPVIGITGSNGKTILKEWIFQTLQEQVKILRSPKSYNSQVGVPLSVLQLDEVYQMAVFEAGISKPGEMDILENIIAPDTGIITNIGDAHQENFSSYEEKAREKLQLFKNCSTIIYPKSSHLLDTLISSLYPGKHFYTYAWHDDTDAYLKIENTEISRKSTRITGVCNTKRQEISIPFVDKPSVENSIHLWTFLLSLGYDQTTIASAMKQLISVAMRLEVKDGINNCTIINDSYNSDITSLQGALENLALQKQHRYKTLILSDMLQCAHDEYGLYRYIAEMLSNYDIHRLIGIGERISQYSGLFEGNQAGSFDREFYKTTDAFLSSLKYYHFSDEAILLKGSRDYQFERIASALQEKTHRTVLEIDMDAIVYNLAYFRNLLKKECRVMAMVKAFSYGSGSYKVANVLQDNNVDYLGVAVVDEGIELRNGGLTIPIVVLNPEPESFEAMIQYSLEPEIYNFQILHQFDTLLKKAGIVQYPVHIKLDTGMHRLGFMEAQLPALVERLKASQRIYVKSIFSHLAASDDPEQDDYTEKQIHAFTRMSNTLIQILGYPVIRHILNSGGIERFPHAQFDMVRLGIGLYGISRLNQDYLKNISTLKTHILQIKHLRKGDTVGYGRAGKLQRDSRIAILPIGYADGFNRLLSKGKGEVIINGSRAPVVGNVCMDMTMVDITDIDAREGDDAIIFGEEYPITHLAEKLNTIPYEILTNVSQRVKRIYIQKYN